MDTHLTVGIYANKDCVYNIVRDLDLASHIEYNKTFRPGRLLYVNGIRVHNGCIKEEYLEEYDEVYNQFVKQLSDIKNKQPTIPYR